MVLDDILVPAGDNQDCISEIPSGTLNAPLDSLVTGMMCAELFLSPVYPSDHDVETGVTYGPTGSDYTGVFGVPVVGNVLDGVWYGAHNTEFEGTYVGGGGALFDVFGNSVIKFKEG